MDWVRDQHSFPALAAYRGDDHNLTAWASRSASAPRWSLLASFQCWASIPWSDASFVPKKSRIGAQPVALISGGFWKREFGSSPGPVGKTLDLNGVGYTIVGVIPASFHYQSFNFQDNTGLFVPLGQWNLLICGTLNLVPLRVTHGAGIQAASGPVGATSLRTYA